MEFVGFCISFMAALILCIVAYASAVIYAPLLREALRLKIKGNMPPLPPGSMGLPYWGESLKYLQSWSNKDNPDVWYDTRKAAHGGIFTTHILGGPTVVMLGPQANKFILLNENKLFRNSWPQSMEVLLGEHSLSWSQGMDYKRISHVIQSVLGQESMRKAVARFEGLLLNHLDSDWHSGTIIQAYSRIKDMLLCVAAEYFMELKPGKELDTFKRHFDLLSSGLLSQPLDLPWTVFGKAKRVRSSMIAQVQKQIQLHRESMQATRKEGGEMDGNFLDMMLSAQEAGSEFSLSDEEIADNLMGLLLGGRDTTACALATILKYLSCSPHILQRLRKDCKQVRDRKEEGEPLTWSDIKGIEYLHNIILEGLRIVPPVNGGFKKAKIDVLYEGYTIPKGWKVHYSMRQTHNKEEYFTNPNQFDPDRFNNKHEPFSFIPFGQGNRMCRGNEYAKLVMEMFLYHLVLRYDWDLVEPNETMIMYFIPHPSHGLPLLLKPISYGKI